MEKIYIGKNISYLRNKKKLSQFAVGKEFNVGTTTWSAYEREKIKPSFDMLIQMARFFDVSLDDLVYKDLSILEANEPKQVYTQSPQSNILRIIEEEWEEVKQEVEELRERIRRLEEGG